VSFEKIHAFRTGLLFEKREHFVFVLFLLFRKKSTASLDKIFSETVSNQQIQSVLNKLSSRYTFIFCREPNNHPAIKMNLYLIGRSQKDLTEKTKRAVSKLRALFDVLGLEFIIQDARKELEKIKIKMPKAIASIRPAVFLIEDSKASSFFSAIKLNLNSLEERRDFLVLLKDFYSIFNTGRIILDVYKDEALSQVAARNELKIAILIILEGKNKEMIMKEQKRLLSLLSMLQLSLLEDGKQKYQQIPEWELKANFLKILFNQAWDFRSVETRDWLNFLEFFKLL